MQLLSVLNVQLLAKSVWMLQHVQNAPYHISFQSVNVLHLAMTQLPSTTQLRTNAKNVPKHVRLVILLVAYLALLPIHIYQGKTV
jgi:hypothetical protein